MKSETIARLLLFLLLAVAGFVGILALGPALGLAVPAAQADYEIHARLPENGGWSQDTLYVKVGQPIRVRLTSDDALHSFAVGQSAVPPVDLKPGEWAETTLVFDQPGRYTFYCTRWCGRNHWRMRGTIIVTSDAAVASQPVQKPLYLRLGLDLDAPHPAEDLPAAEPSAGGSPSTDGAAAGLLPTWALDRQTYLTSSPSGLWKRLRGESNLKGLSDAQLWNTVAYLWARQVTPAGLAEAKQLYATNCAACHGETGKGDGVMVEGLPRYVPGETHTSPSTGTPAGDTAGMAMDPSGDMRLSAPPDLTDPQTLLGASPALLEGKMLRGGMGTGMPNWGPIFTQSQMDNLITYLYTFAMK